MAKDEQTPEALARLLAEHGTALVLYARQWTSAPEDIVQNALIELVTQPIPPARVVPWLYRVVRNGAISAQRGERRRLRRETAVATNASWFEAGSSRLDAEEASATLATLPSEMREVVVARIWGELTFAEIAELVGTSLSTAQRRYEQGLRELQSRLEKPCKNQPPRTTT
jgi:RNA polymerase sigma-70 factor (ECF subfamily)